MRDNTVRWLGGKISEDMYGLVEYIKHEIKSFIQISKHREESSKYDVQRSIFDEIQGVWIADEILSGVFDISSQSKQKQRSKWRCKMMKSMLTKTKCPNLLHS